MEKAGSRGQSDFVTEIYKQMSKIFGKFSALVRVTIRREGYIEHLRD